MKIIAVVVTYNRSQWLIECLQSLVKQTRACDGIVVVDNHSSDDTVNKLNEFVKINPNVNCQLELLTNNTGGAGGFKHGMETAFNLGADYIWVMDDDVEALPDALEKLLKFSDKGDILHGRRKNPDGSYFYWQHTFMPWIGFSFPVADTAFETKDVCYPNTTCFEGALIKRKVIQKIGLPNEKYFLAWDDTEYGYRASDFFKIAYCNCDVLLRKKGGDSLNVKVRKLAAPSALYQYYHIRNRFLLFNALTHNASLTKKVLMGGAFHSFTLILIVKEVARSAIFKDWTLGLRPIFKGFKDGVLGDFGKGSW